MLYFTTMQYIRRKGVFELEHIKESREDEKNDWYMYCSNNVPCKKILYPLLTKAKINNILYFSNMGGKLRKGHYGGNYV